MHTPVIDWCQIMEQGTGNLIIRQLMVLMETSVPGLVHKCPYEVFRSYLNVKVI